MNSKTVLEMIGKATALAAFLFTVATFSYDQYQKRQGARYAAATDLIERYRSDGVRNAGNGTGPADAVLPSERAGSQ